jgi:uncharacterized protein
VAHNAYGHAGDDLSSAFWRLLTSGRFSVQRCDSCGEHRFPPNNLCPVCHSLGYEWVAVSGTGTIFSYTVVRRAPNDEWAARAPYFLIVARLAEGPLVLGHLRVTEGARVDVGSGVHLSVVPRPDQHAIYEFELTTD